MKYLYKILRLFFCPHKYNKTLNKADIVTTVDKRIVGFSYTSQCSYCGRIKNYTFL